MEVIIANNDWAKHLSSRVGERGETLTTSFQEEGCEGEDCKNKHQLLCGFY